MTRPTFHPSAELIVGAVLVACTLVALLALSERKVQAAFPGENGRIAFVSGYPDIDEIYSINPDGSGLRIETDDRYIDADPAFSPDGTKIAYASRDEIFVRVVGSNQETQLTDNAAFDADPAFSPDGTKIVFRSDRGDDDELYTMDADGTDQRRLTNTSDSAGPFDPAWSPDGARIAFALYRDIYSIKPDGTAQRSLTDNSSPVYVGSPSWSPDGERIAFERFSKTVRPARADVYVMSADGTDQKNLTEPMEWGEDLNPAFSPDGTRIAYARYVKRQGGGQYRIKIMNATDGSGKEKVYTARLSNAFDLDWRPKPARP